MPGISLMPARIFGEFCIKQRAQPKPAAILLVAAGFCCCTLPGLPEHITHPSSNNFTAYYHCPGRKIKTVSSWILIPRCRSVRSSACRSCRDAPSSPGSGRVPVPRRRSCSGRAHPTWMRRTRRLSARPIRPAAEEMLTMEPPPAARIGAMTAHEGR